MAFWRSIPAAIEVGRAPDPPPELPSALALPRASNRPPSPFEVERRGSGALEAQQPSLRDAVQTVIDEGREQRGKLDAGGPRVHPRTIRREPSMVRVVQQALQQDKDKKKRLGLGSLLGRRKSKEAKGRRSESEAPRVGSGSQVDDVKNHKEEEVLSSESSDSEEDTEPPVDNFSHRRGSLSRPIATAPPLARSKSTHSPVPPSASPPVAPQPRPLPLQRRSTVAELASAPPRPSSSTKPLQPYQREEVVAYGVYQGARRVSVNYATRSQSHRVSGAEEDQEEERYYATVTPFPPTRHKRSPSPPFIPPPSLAHRSPPTSPRMPPPPSAPRPPSTAPSQPFRPPHDAMARLSISSRPGYGPRPPSPPSRPQALAAPPPASPRRPTDGYFGITGLSNLGNTCYLSSVIQGLSATEQFASFLASGDYKAEINRNNTWGTRGVLAKATAQLIRVLQSEELITAAPTTFRNTFVTFKPDFAGNGQFDAQEVLGYVLDGLHEDLNLVLTRPPPPPPNSPEMEARLERLPEVIGADLDWEKYLERNDSIVVELFQGQLRSKLTCLTCQRTSTTFNAFQTLSLPIPTPTRQHPNIDLADCINAFLKSEVIGGEDAWNCPRCRSPQSSSKWLSISRLPPILIIHLKRFASFDTVSEKVETPVEFPPSLDLSDLLPRVPKGMARPIPDQSNGRKEYELYAVINHYPHRRGDELGSGHYTAMIKRQDEWLELDDEVMEIIDAEVVAEASQSAYLLWYRLQS